MQRNVGAQDAYWRIGTGIAALWWASRRKRSRLAKVTAGIYGLVVLAEGVTRYDPLLDALGLSTAGVDDNRGKWTPATEEEDGDGASEAGGAAPPARTLLRVGRLALQSLPRRRPRTLWGVAQDGKGTEYTAPVAAESNNWSWDELEDME